MNKEFKYDQNEKTLTVIHFDNDGKVTSEVIICIGWDIERRLIDIDTYSIYFEMSVEYAGCLIMQTISRKELSPGALSRYSEFGFPFTSEHDVQEIIEYIIEIEEYLHTEMITATLGWKSYEAEMIFQLKKSISIAGDININYSGNLMVDSKGTFQQYKELLEEFVVPYISTQTIVAFSVSSALATLLNPEYTLILHMCGNSTSGKTTMLKLAASVWGSTEINTNGIVQTWHSTANAFINSLCGYNGITLCFDELGVSEADTNSLIYLLANGTDKKRMTSTKAPQKFSINVCSSGEIPMKTIEGVNGTDARLLEINTTWTDTVLRKVLGLVPLR